MVAIVSRCKCNNNNNNKSDLGNVKNFIIFELLFVFVSFGPTCNGSEEVDAVEGTLKLTGPWCPPPALDAIRNGNLSFTAPAGSSSSSPSSWSGHLTSDYLPLYTKLFVICDDGYRIEAARDNFVECKAGRWISASLSSLSSSGSTSMSASSKVEDMKLPECQMWCRRPKIPHGEIQSIGTEFAPGTKVEVRCEEGYRFSNKFVNFVQCSSDEGKWTGHNGEFTREFPHCVPATCPPLAITSNSILEYRGTTGWDGGFHEGSQVSYACRQGFKLSFGDGGPSTDREFECRNGVWQNLIQVTCELVGCGPPPSIADGEVVDDRSNSGFIGGGGGGPNEVVGRGGSGKQKLEAAWPYPVGVRIGYRCNPGFALNGSPKRYRCSAKGHWVPTRLPICRNIISDEQKSQDCPAPPMISRARLENATAGPFPPSSAVFYVCDEGFTLEGLPNLICDQSGQWLPRPGPACRPNIILPEGCLKPGPPSRNGDAPSNGDGGAILVESGRQMVPLLVGVLVSAVLLTILLAVQLTRKGGWKYLSGWRSCAHAVVPMCRHPSDDDDVVVVRRNAGNGGEGPNLERGSDQLREHSASSLVYCEPDRVALLNGIRGHPQVLPPTYEEAIQESQRASCGGGGIGGSGYGYGYGCGVFLAAAGARNRCYRFASLRNNASSGCAHPATCAAAAAANDGVNPQVAAAAAAGVTNRQHGPPSISQGRSSSVADSLNSTDTVTPSEVSTTVTVDTLSSNASSHQTSSISTRAFCGSLASFDTAESDSALNMEGVPLLEETEMEQGGISPSSETRPVLET